MREIGPVQSHYHEGSIDDIHEVQLPACDSRAVSSSVSFYDKPANIYTL